MTTHTASCHCGAVRFEFDTPVTPALRCNCSICRRKGALMSPPMRREDLRIVQGEDMLSLYQFNSGDSEHYFCKVCGIYPFHQSQKDPVRWRVNLGCVDGLDSLALPYDVFDGAST